MKQFDVHDVTIGENQFHIFPFPAMRAANLSAELMKTLAPIVPVIATIMGGKENILSSDASSVVSALQTIDGDKLENLLTKLLIRDRNVSIEQNGNAVPLTESIINEVFCASIEDLYALAIEVIKVNYGGFFEKLGLQYGNAGDQ